MDYYSFTDPGGTVG